MSDIELPKYILITGASSGIGKACAIYLDDRGYTIFAGVRSKTDANTLRKECSSRLIPVLIDVCNKQSIKAAYEVIRKATNQSGLDGLINNSGIPLAGPLEYLNIDKFRQQIEVNLVGLVAVTQTFLPLLRICKGKIINMGSISGRIALPFLGPYSATKFALEAITDSMRVELRPWGISVSIIEPGNVETLIRQKAFSGIEEDILTLPPLAHTLYGPIFKTSQNHATRKNMSPTVVAKIVENILAARKPKPRYLVGSDAVMISLIQKLPTWLRDAFIAKRLPKYGN